MNKHAINSTRNRVDRPDNIVDINLHNTQKRLESAGISEVNLEKAFAYWPLGETEKGEEIFVCNEHGSFIYKTQPGSKGQTLKPTKVSVVPVYPTKIINQIKDGIETQYYRFKVLNIATGKWVDATVPAGALVNASKKELGSLTNLSITIRQNYGLSGNITTIAKFGRENGSVELVNAIAKPGWDEERKHYIKHEDDCYVGDVRSIVNIAGDKEAYVKRLTKIVKQNPMVGFAVAAAVAAYLRGSFTDTETSIINFYGPSSVGKSMLREVLDSLAGHTKKSWSSTMASREVLMEAHNSTYFTLDEFSGLVSKLGHNRQRVHAELMSIANEGGRLKMVGIGEAESKTWLSQVFSNSNESFYNYETGMDNGQEDTLTARVFEIEIKDKYGIWNFKTLKEVNENYDFFKANKGHLHADIVEAVSNEDIRQEAQDEFERLRAEFAVSFNDDTPTPIARRSETLALAYAGAVVCEHILGKGVMDAGREQLETLKTALVADGIEGKRERLEKLKSDILDIIRLTSENDQIAYRGHMFDRDLHRQQQKALDSFDNISNIYCLVEQGKPMVNRYDFDGQVNFVKSKLSDKKYAQLNLDILATRAKDLGVLKHRKDRMTRQTELLGNQYVYTFRLDILNNLLKVEDQKIIAINLLAKRAELEERGLPEDVIEQDLAVYAEEMQPQPKYSELNDYDGDVPFWCQRAIVAKHKKSQVNDLAFYLKPKLFYMLA